jgi:mRNA interferase RelE/StbE
VTRVTLSSRAQRDLRRIDRPDRERITDGLRPLSQHPPPENLDVKPLVGRAPWLRMRVGNYRVLFRSDEDVVLVARVVHRRDLEAAVIRL